PGRGARTRVQDLPFQCRISAAGRGPRAAGPAPTTAPTAHTLLGEVTVTPFSLASAGPGLGLRDHCLPFQCRISAAREPPAVRTAQAFLADDAPTAAR